MTVRRGGGVCGGDDECVTGGIGSGGGRGSRNLNFCDRICQIVDCCDQISRIVDCCNHVSYFTDRRENGSRIISCEPVPRIVNYCEEYT